MASYCSASDTVATVTIIKNGAKSLVKIRQNLPITVTCKDSNYPDCKQVKLQIRAFNYSNALQQGYGNIPLVTNVWTPVLGLRVTSDGSTIQAYCRGHFGDSCGTPGWYTVYTRIGSGYYKDPSIVAVYPQNSDDIPTGGKGVIITDSLGNVVFNDNDASCNWTVNCGNCPAGQDEHQINDYPGYCCLDCAGIKAEIKAMTSQVRNVRNG
ncbi:hypothetical protein [uncultured Nostoc sp.]|uniref:hypothetical protein n=1 Tax=uncultured Nostoc sp. TaxID=340711 RepID=UPI0035C9BE63